MLKEGPLLEYVALQLNCMYLSDLRYLSMRQRKKASDLLRHMEAADDDLWEWNDALEYLTDCGQKCATAAQAKELLVKELQFRRKKVKSRRTVYGV